MDVLKKLHSQEATRKLTAVDIRPLVDVCARENHKFSIKSARLSLAPLMRLAQNFREIAWTFGARGYLDLVAVIKIKKRFANSDWVVVEMKLQLEVSSQLRSAIFIFIKHKLDAMLISRQDYDNRSSIKFGYHPS